ncbi:MAG: plasmid recombination protein [Clostridia bacterium]|nr:plasmid recombination protein [Clostridia bacterium]
MNLNYAIFRSEPIMTLKDLAQIGSHNKREKNAYASNPDIKKELSQNNIELVPLTNKYVKGFKIITKDYEMEHKERMKSERTDRQKTFNQMLDKSKNVVADELLFTATHKFFDNMENDEIKDWGNTCMEFVYKDLGYSKEQILHATIHLDEETPHLHCVVVPLIKKYDNRTKKERYTITKKHYIRDKIHLSELQDKYHKRLIEKGYDLERGIKGSKLTHQKTKELKKTTRYYEQKINIMNNKLNSAILDFEDKMKTTKNTFVGKDYVKVKKDTFESMNNVIIESKRINEFQPKMEQLFLEVDNYTKSHEILENDNKILEKEVQHLKAKNNDLNIENRYLKDLIDSILKVIKDFFRTLLQIGNEETKKITANEIKLHYSAKQLNKNDVYQIAKKTSKEEELFKYANIQYYTKIKSNNKKEYEMEL